MVCPVCATAAPVVIRTVPAAAGGGRMIATTTTRDDCGLQTLALLQATPAARGFVGACIVCGGRSLLTGQDVPGLLLPWNHHAWAIGPDGALIDPTAAALLSACDFLGDLYAPPAPLEQLRPVVVRDRAAQAAAVDRLRGLAVFNPEPFEPIEAGPALLYLPGWGLDGKARPVWQRLAKLSQGSGFRAADLAAALHPAPRRSAGRRGFAQGVA